MKRQIIFLTLARTIVTTSARMIFPFLAVFARGMGVGIPAVSLAVTARSLTGAGIPFINALLDRHPRRLSMILGMVLFIIGAGLVAIFPTFGVFIIALCLSYLGGFLFIASTQAYVGDQVPYEKRGMAMAVLETGWAMGFIIGVPLAGLLIGRFGWQSPFAAMALLMALALVVLLFLIPSLPAPASTESGAGDFWRNLRLLATTPQALLGMAMCLGIPLANQMINMMFGVWVEESFGLKIAALGLFTAAIGISDLVGEIASGFLVDNLGKERTIVLGLLLIAFSGLVMPWLDFSIWAALAGLCIFYFAYELAFVGNLTLITEVLPEARATIMGGHVAMMSLAGVLGALIAPWIYQMGYYANGIAALVICLFTGLALSRMKKPGRETS